MCGGLLFPQIEQSDNGNHLENLRVQQMDITRAAADLLVQERFSAEVIGNCGIHQWLVRHIGKAQKI
jgi:hypothetical protein